MHTLIDLHDLNRSIGVIFMFDDEHNFPNAIEMKKQLLSAMFTKQGQVVPDVAAILDADDLQKIDHLYLLSLIDATDTTGLAVSHAKTIKEKAERRRLIKPLKSSSTTRLKLPTN